MKKTAAITLLFLAVSGGGVAPAAWAGPNANARLLIHLMAPTGKNACGRPEATPDCAGVNTAGAVVPIHYFAYLLVAGGSDSAGVAGVQCGIRYNGEDNAGLDILDWKNCGTLEFPSGDWPAAGGGNLVTWDSTKRCQKSMPHGPGMGVETVVGYFYCVAYGADTLRVIPRPVDGAAKVADCKSSSEEDTIAGKGAPTTEPRLGYAVFSPGARHAGFAPCAPAGAPAGGPAKPPTPSPAPKKKP